MKSAGKTEEIAALWLAREDRGFTEEEAAQFLAWLESDGAHRVGYLRLKSVWRRADRLAALKLPVARSPAQTRMHIPMAIAAMLVIAVCGAGAVYYNYRATTRPVFVTAVGRQESVRLADGSRMELNTNTQVSTNVTNKERSVTLVAGEAYFEIVHDASRPFVVYAGNRRITDLGTKFSVLRNGNDVQVVVKEGRVRVDVLHAQEVSAPVTADGGKVVVAHDNATLVVAKETKDIDDVLGWRQGMLIFNQETLAEVAEQFNRYNQKQIVVRGKARDVHIGGSFKANNVDVFTALLHQGFGLAVRDTGRQIIISD